MYLIAGLGNPGSKYVRTRHNVGFMFLDYLASRHGFTFSDSKWQARIALQNLWQTRILFIKPETFMNLSGQAISRAASYYKIFPEKIVVIHDDLDMDVGRIKIVINRGAGGHRGIRSITNLLGTKEYVRIKIGIGRPLQPIPVERYVLSKFSDDEKKILQESADVIEQAVQLILTENTAVAMNIINSLK